MAIKTRPIVVCGRKLMPTAVFDSYWSFAVERQRIYEQRVARRPAPWTSDSIIANHRFTNVFRASDRVSQYLIRDILYAGDYDELSQLFRVLLFKLFNKIETWEHLCNHLEDVSLATFAYEDYDSILSSLHKSKATMYSAAYVIPPPKFGEDRKYQNHLRLIEHIFRSNTAKDILASRSLQQLYCTLREVPSLGDFLAYQLATDLNYSEIFEFDELEYVVAGPGAVDGIRKCFGPASAGIEAAIIRWVVENQLACCEERGLASPTLWGRRIKLIDAQNLFCEVDKYARARHPEVASPSGRTKIKQKYKSEGNRLDPPFFPPFWRINKLIDNNSGQHSQVAEDSSPRQLALL